MSLPALPARLERFFARYPPQLYSAKFTGITIPLTRKDAKEAAVTRSDGTKTLLKRSYRNALGQPILISSTTTPSPPSDSTGSPAGTESATAAEGSETDPSPATPTPALQALRKLPPNPFLPTKNHNTGRWAGAKIGLRRQAELVKLAQKYGIEDLLPPSRKSSAFKHARLLERGLRIKGTGEGQKVKGHKWERRMGATLEKRRKAMENMPALIREWKQKGHGRGWAKYPSSKTMKNM